MADVAFTSGLDLWSGFTSDTVKALLVQSTYTAANRDHVYVDDIVPATYEVSVVGYSRPTLGTKTRTVDTTLDRITYTCADPAFGSLTAGQTVGGMIVYKFVTNDADSLLLGYYDFTDTATAGAAFTVNISTSGLYYVDQA